MRLSWFYYKYIKKILAKSVRYILSTPAILHEPAGVIALIERVKELVNVLNSELNNAVVDYDH